MIKCAQVTFDTTQSDNQRRYSYYFCDTTLDVKEGDVVVVECKRLEGTILCLALVCEVTDVVPKVATRPVLFVLPIKHIIDNKVDQENLMLGGLL